MFHKVRKVGFLRTFATEADRHRMFFEGARRYADFPQILVKDNPLHNENYNVKTRHKKRRLGK